MSEVILKIEDGTVQVCPFTEDTFSDYFKPVNSKDMSIGDIIKIHLNENVDDMGYQYFLYKSSTEFDNILKNYMYDSVDYDITRMSFDNDRDPPEEPSINILGTEYKIDNYIESLSDFI